MRELQEPCELGCTAPDTCVQLVPSNGIAPGVVTDALADWEAPAGLTTIDLDAGTVTPPLAAAVTPAVVSQGADAPELVVYAFRTLTIPVGAEVKVSGARGLVLLAGRIEVRGTLVARAVGKLPGPGGGRGGCSTAGEGKGGGKPGLRGTGVDDGGGGGGGHASPGGLGGQGALGGAGGATFGSPTLTPLVGGSGGGVGSPGSAAVAACGGGGGGALQLIAASELVISGAILAGGGGGEAGTVNANNGGGGGGGGSGGALLLEAPTVSCTASSLLAAGGGGGGGTPKFTAPGTAGADSVGVGAAMGGVGNTDEGWGGAGSLKAGPGNPAVPGADNGGGGGGGAGRIRINARSLSELGAVNGAKTQGELASRLAP